MSVKNRVMDRRWLLNKMIEKNCDLASFNCDLIRSDRTNNSDKISLLRDTIRLLEATQKLVKDDGDLAAYLLTIP